MAETESDIVRIAREYRQQLERNETEAMKEMSRAWVRMERAMRGEFEALAVIISEKAEAGEPVPAQFVYSLKRYQEMLIQLQSEIAKYNSTAEDIIKTRQRENIELGLAGAGEQLTVSAPVGIEWVKIYPEAAENMVGYAADGSPLKTLLEHDYQTGAQAVTDALIDGVGLGKGWKAVAADMEKAVGMSFDRSVTIARTEMARAYRQANMRQYQASGVVEKVYRLAYKPTACFACLILDGTEIKGEFEDHPRGKCTSIVQTIGGHRPTWQTGSEWFMEQSADDQRRLMGAGRWELWKDGVIKSLSDFVYIRPNQSWGGSPAVKTFDMLGVQSPLRQPKPAAGVQAVHTPQEELLNYGWCKQVYVSADHPEDIERIVSGMTDEQAKVFRNGTSELKTVNTNYSGRGVYKHGERSVNVNLNKNDPRSARLGYPNTSVQTLFHELSHAIDYNFGDDKRRIAYMPGLIDKVQEDALKWVNELLKDNGLKPIKNLVQISDKQKRIVHMALKYDGGVRYAHVSDILEGLTRGVLGGWNNGCWGHGLEYWRSIGQNINTEFVAHAGSAWIVGDPGFQEAFGDAESGGALQMVIDEMRKRYAN